MEPWERAILLGLTFSIASAVSIGSCILHDWLYGKFGESEVEDADE